MGSNQIVEDESRASGILTKLRHCQGQVKEGDFITFNARVHAVHDVKSHDAIELVLRDEASFALAFIERGTVNFQTFETAQNLTRESIVHVSARVTYSGVLNTTTGKELSPLSIQVSSLTVVASAVRDLPHAIFSHLGPGDKPNKDLPGSNEGALVLQERLNNRIIDGRVAATGAIFRLFSSLHELIVEYLSAEGFDWVPTPSLINYRIPGDDDYFSVPYLDGTEAWLTQTGELHIGMALATGLEKVYDIHTVFRREKIPSSRHLTEFIALEAGFVIEHDWHEVLERVESLFIFILTGLQQRKKNAHFLKLVQRLYPEAGQFKVTIAEDGKIPRIKFAEAKAHLRDTLGVKTNDYDDLTRDEEAALGHWFSSQGNDIFFITHYPKHLRPYNVQPSEDGNGTTNSFDVILRGQEVCSGSQAINSHIALREAMSSRDPPFDPDDSIWRPFLGAYEAGAPPQGGFGIKNLRLLSDILVGLNRLLQSILGLAHVSETVLFPRDASRLAP